MKRLSFISFVFFAYFAAALAQDTLSVVGLKVNKNNEPWGTYNPERGYFQKAFSDKGDPRFMITTEDGKFEFGVGGEIDINAFGDFAGSLDNSEFSTWDINVPTYYSSHIGIMSAGSKLFFKGRAKFGRHTLISYVELGANEEMDVSMKQAYFSYDGLSVGRTHTFFEDLAAGVQTVDPRGPNTSIAKCHPLVGYTFDLGKHFTIGAAVEQPGFAINDYTNLGLYEEYHTMPDFAARFIYHDTFGHLQFSALVRQLSYWGVDGPYKDISKLTYIDDSNGTAYHKTGYGFALSGTVNLTPKCFVTFQGLYGRGIQQYIKELNNTGIDLIPTRINADDPDNMYYRMRTVPAWGGYAGLQYNWSKRLSTSVVYGMVGMDLNPVSNLTWGGNISETEYEQECKLYDYRRTAYLAVNAFYHLNDYCTFGIEYLHGGRWERNRLYDPALSHPLQPGTSRGDANRIDLMFSYAF